MKDEISGGILNGRKGATRQGELERTEKMMMLCKVEENIITTVGEKEPHLPL